MATQMSSLAHMATLAQSTTNKQYGVIAQDVEKYIPEIIKTNDIGFKMISYNKFIPFLIEAIKTQQKQINELKKENENMKKENEIMKKDNEIIKNDNKKMNDTITKIFKRLNKLEKI